MKISFFGLGYVGLVSSLVFADKNNLVIGVEINEEKRDMLNKGISPISEPGINDLLKKYIGNNFIVESDYIEAVNNTDISFIAVGTPSSGDGSINLVYVERVINEIGEAIKKKGKYHLIVIRSTVLPGTTDSMIKKLVDMGLKEDKDFNIIFHPEFLREGTAITDFLSPPFTVVGGKHNEKIEKIMKGLYEFITNIPFYYVDTKVAETVKYASNSFHALKVTFANEIGRYCKVNGINATDVMDIFMQDNILNISKVYLRPGFAYGGSCLPKDVKALLSSALSKGIDVPLLESVIESNNKHIDFAFSLIKERFFKGRIGFIGVSFKKDTDDLRESPIIELIRKVYPEYNIKVYDPIVQKSYITGSNKVFIDKNAAFLRDNMVDDIQELSSVDVIVVYSYRNKEVFEFIKDKCGDKMILDLVGIKDEKIKQLKNYVGICW